jgi:putative transposase
MMGQRLTYIRDNPVKAGIVRCSEDYIYSSAINYSGKKGLIEVEFIG